MSRPALWPREHGAYGQLLLPLATALAAGTSGPSAWLLALAALAGFLAHEPLLVALGRRGERARAEHGGSARRRLLLLALVAAVTGVAALRQASEAARLGSLLPLALAAVMLVLIDRGRERTTPGEALASATLAGAALPVALAAGVDGSRAVAAWLTWTLAFAASTAAVRAVIALHKGGAAVFETHLLLVASSAAAGAVALGLTSVGAALPLLAAGWLLRLRPPAPRHLKRVGWSLLAASLATALLLLSWPRA